MTVQIKTKWWSEKYHVGITESKEVFRVNSENNLSRLNLELSGNSLCFRARGENKRIGKLSLMKSIVKKEIIIQEFLPF